MDTTAVVILFSLLLFSTLLIPIWLRLKYIIHPIMWESIDIIADHNQMELDKLMLLSSARLIKETEENIFEEYYENIIDYGYATDRSMLLMSLDIRKWKLEDFFPEVHKAKIRLEKENEKNSRRLIKTSKRWKPKCDCSRM